VLLSTTDLIASRPVDPLEIFAGYESYAVTNTVNLDQGKIEKRGRHFVWTVDKATGKIVHEWAGGDATYEPSEAGHKQFFEDSIASLNMRLNSTWNYLDEQRRIEYIYILMSLEYLSEKDWGNLLQELILRHESGAGMTLRMDESEIRVFTYPFMGSKSTPYDIDRQDGTIKHYNPYTGEPTIYKPGDADYKNNLDAMLSQVNDALNIEWKKPLASVQRIFVELIKVELQSYLPTASSVQVLSGKVVINESQQYASLETHNGMYTFEKSAGNPLWDNLVQSNGETVTVLARVMDDPDAHAKQAEPTISKPLIIGSDVLRLDPLHIQDNYDLLKQSI